MKSHKGNRGSQNKGSLARNEKRFFQKENEGKSVRVERRRCTLVGSLTGVTGNPMAYSVGSNNASASFEFSNCALLYQEYRVRAIRMKVVPRFRDNIQSPASIPYPGALVSGGFVMGAGAATPAAIFAESNSKVSPEWTAPEQLVTWELNPNAKLWTPTSATISTANQFGVQLLSTGNCPAFYNTVTTADTFVEFDVEFRTAQ